MNPNENLDRVIEEASKSNVYFKDHLKNVSPQDAAEIKKIINKHEKSMKEALTKIEKFVPGQKTAELATFVGEYIPQNSGALSDIRKVLGKKSH